MICVEAELAAAMLNSSLPGAAGHGSGGKPDACRTSGTPLLVVVPHFLVRREGTRMPLQRDLDVSGAAWLSEIESSKDLVQLHQVVDHVLSLFGVEIYRYHVVAEGLRSLTFLESLRLSTFPAEWMQTYALSGFFDIDPVIQTAQTSTKPFRWWDVEHSPELSERQRTYFNELRAAGFRDGWGVPVYGPAQLVGYFGVGAMTRWLDLNETEMLALQAVCERAHLRMFDFNVGARPQVSLSARESEVLEWASVGKSNDAIATILGISPHTVDTHLRRIFHKLSAFNRTEAVIAGFQSGALTLERYREMKGLRRVPFA
jgi:LuxR family transcriptional regulator/LuxR family quorum-sensing system transcriptional regulator CciR